MFSNIACFSFLNVHMSGLVAKRTRSASKYIKILSQGKKQKLERDDVTSPLSLSPEQLDRISKNKKAALERLSANQTVPSGIGESWKKALNAEFGKPYFRSVSDQHMKNSRRFELPEMKSNTTAFLLRS